MEENRPCIGSCVDCGVQACYHGGRYPDFCPTLDVTEEDRTRLYAQYEEEDNRLLANAANSAKAKYGKDTRVENILEFARQIHAQKIGVATCVSTLDEARVMAQILRRHGFTVYSCMCKIGSMEREQDIQRGVKMCNPILQAEYLNKMGTQLNIEIGLCVGHDSLFYRYSHAPVTTLVAKDHALKHNPILSLRDSAIYESL